MIGIGTIINCAAIVAGGLAGHLTGKLFGREQQDALTKACGISVLFIAIAGAMQGMLKIDGNTLVSGKSMLVVLCLALGTMIGELIGIEKGFEHFLDEEELRQSEEAPEHYMNRYEIQFFHDFNMWDPLRDQLPAVQDKYERRIRHFYQITAEPTLFIRYMDDRILDADGTVHELRYVEENYAHVMDVLKGLCPENELILIANSGVKSEKLKIYSVEKDRGDVVARVPREKNRELGELLDSFSVPDQEANRLRGEAAARRRKKIELRHKADVVLVRLGIRKPYRHGKTYR